MALILLGLCLAACGWEPTRARETPDRSSETRRVRCDVGGRPGYFVPAAGPPVLIGCASLGVSGRRVEFSTDRVRIDGEPHVCINPAYGPRGRFIPTICSPHPPRWRLAIHDAGRPRQGVRGYARVVWGIVRPTTTSVVARAGSGVARAVLFDLSPGEKGPSPLVYVLELPLAVPCEKAVIVATGAHATERARPRRDACARLGE